MEDNTDADAERDLLYYLARVSPWSKVKVSAIVNMYTLSALYIKILTSNNGWRLSPLSKYLMNICGEYFVRMFLDFLAHRLIIGVESLGSCFFLSFDFTIHLLMIILNWKIISKLQVNRWNIQSTTQNIFESLSLSLNIFKEIIIASRYHNETIYNSYPATSISISNKYIAQNTYEIIAPIVLYFRTRLFFNIFIIDFA